MNSLENLRVTGKLNIVLRDEQGNIKDTREVDNLVVTSGATYIASRMKDATATAMSHMAVGTGSVAAVAGNTTLTEVARVALTSTTANPLNIQYVASFAAGTGTAALTEAGIFNAASAGTMLCRTVFAVINKGALDSMTITWTITITPV